MPVETTQRRRRRWPYVLAGLVVVAIGAWFAAAGPRADAARTQHDRALAAWNSQDYRTAYRHARTAVALDGSVADFNMLGAAAYGLGQYATATDSFAAASRQGSRDGTVGWLASAAADGNRRQLDQARTAFGTPRNDFERAFLAHVLVAAGALDLVQEQFGTSAPETGPEAAARSIAAAVDDPAQALTFLQASVPGGVDVALADPTLQRIATETITLPEGARAKLATTIAALQRPVSQATRKLLLAGRLLEFHRSRAAATLADGAVRDEPDYRDAWNTLAAAQLDLRDTAGAKRSLDISVDLDRAYGYTWYLKSQLAGRTDQADDATQFAEQAERLGYHGP